MMSERLEQRLSRFLRTGEGDFKPLSLELFAYQFEKNNPYQVFCRAQGVTPASLSRWEDIPAVPIQAYRVSVLATFPVSRAAAVFHSSGTMGQNPSRHYLRTLSYYEAALRFSFARHVLFDKAAMPFLILAPSPGDSPHSSLSWMLEVARRTWGAIGSDYFFQRGALDDDRLAKVLAKKQSAAEPVALVGTTLAFLVFFDRCARSGRAFRCAPGSRLMDTGGMKTRTRQASRGEFLKLTRTTLGVPEELCFNEYGMCELGSQFYARGASTLFKGPPWARSLVIDPLIGGPVTNGRSGLLRHFDLANVDSVLAIQTDDEAELHPDGFILKGRAKGAGLKGCSLEAEEYLSR